MCDIFPEVNNCCFLCSLRIAMLIISVLAIMTGTITLSIIEKTSNADFDKIKNVTDIRDTKLIFSRLHQIIPGALTAMSLVFMFTGVVLLYATLSDQEGFIQVFVWMTFANVIFGFIITIVIGLECTLKELCTLSALDWLTGAIVLVSCIGYLFVWLYFIIVANSYVVQVFP